MNDQFLGLHRRTSTSYRRKEIVTILICHVMDGSASWVFSVTATMPWISESSEMMMAGVYMADAIISWDCNTSVLNFLSGQTTSRTWEIT